MASPLLNPVDVQEVIDIGVACSFLAQDDISKQAAFGNPYAVNTLPILIEGVTDILTFAYVNNNYAAEINSIASYLLSLCGKYIPKAQRLLGQKNGIVVGTSENAPNLIIPRDYPQIIVGKAGSIIQDGDTEFTIIDADAAPNGKIAAWAFVEGNLVDDADATITEQMTIQPQWNASGSYTFFLENGATFRTGQVVKLQYPVFQNLSIPTGTSGTQDLNFYATLNGDETKELKNIKGQYFIVPTNAFEVVQFTLFCVSDAGERFSLVWRGSIYNNAGALTLSEESRTVIGSNPFGEDFFNNIVVSASDTFQSIIITQTGIADKIINCEAQFKFNSSSI